MISISKENKFILSAALVVALVVTISLIFGAIFGFCDNRKIQKQAANIAAKEIQVETGEKIVEKTKQESAEKKGEIKILKEVIRENNVEVSKKTEIRREAAANRARVRSNPVRNVNGAELERILTEAERQP